MTSPYFTIAEAADYCRFTATCKAPDAACRAWLRRAGVPTEKRGSRVLVLRVSIDEALDRATRRRQLRRIA